MTDVDSPQGEDWLLLVYRVPPEPTRLRAAVWRLGLLIVCHCSRHRTLVCSLGSSPGRDEQERDCDREGESVWKSCRRFFRPTNVQVRCDDPMNVQSSLRR